MKASTSISSFQPSTVSQSKKPVNSLILAKTPSQIQLTTDILQTQPQEPDIPINKPVVSKFQFDITIQRVELSVPSPVIIFVQIMKGTNSLTTKKKVKVDQFSKLAVFNEKMSIVTSLSKNTQEEGFQPKQIQIKLQAFYNQKEKTIGYAMIDLSQFLNKTLSLSTKLLFQKCFDKNACVTVDVKIKEQFSQINETIIEETTANDESELCEDYNSTIENIEESRTSTIESARLFTYEDTLDQGLDRLPSFEKLSNRSLTDSSTSSKHSPKPKVVTEISLRQNGENSVKSQRGIKEEMFTQSKEQFKLMTSRALPSTTQPLQIQKQSRNESTLAYHQSQRSTSPGKKSDDYCTSLEEKVKLLEQEVIFLKKENKEQVEKVVTLKLKEERMRDYEVKCNELDTYKQKCEILEIKLRQMQDEQSDVEREKVQISESYERKIHDQKVQLIQYANQLNSIKYEQSKQKQKEVDLPEIAVLTDMSNKKVLDIGNSDDTSGYKVLYDRLISQFKCVQEQNVQLEKRSAGLEQQLMSSKNQIVSLVNELYIIEKEEINGRTYK